MTKQALRKILICAFGFGLCLCLMLAINHVASPALADGRGIRISSDRFKQLIEGAGH